jgi:hypothetical protein
MDFGQTWYILSPSGTLLILKDIRQRSRSPGQIFRQGDTPRFALPLLKHSPVLIPYPIFMKFSALILEINIVFFFL